LQNCAIYVSPYFSPCKAQYPGIYRPLAALILYNEVGWNSNQPVARRQGIVMQTQPVSMILE